MYTHQIRRWMTLIEDFAGPAPAAQQVQARPATGRRGMAAVKAVLRQRVAAHPSDETLAELWDIMNDLWITDSGGLMLFRDLALPQPWQRNLRRKGHTYWSTSTDMATSATVPDTVKVKLIVELPSTAHVEWDDIWETILELHELGKDELRLVAGIPLIIRHIEVDGDDVDSPWLGKTLVA